MNEEPAPPHLILRRLVNGYQVTQAIHVASVLGIADLLASGPRTIEDLATATGTHPDALYRLLRALASIAVFRELDGREFALTPLGDCLRADVPGSIAAWATFVGGQAHWQGWGGLEYSVRTGETAFRHVHGTDSWTFRAQHPEEYERFNRAMTSLISPVIDALLASFDFSRFGTIADIGGGQGSLLAAILGACPKVRGILFDQPQVVAGAGPILSGAGVIDRCSIVGGSFLETVPDGADAYILKSIIHDWDDESAINILQVCRRAMATGASMLVIERELGAPNERPDTKFGDLNMLVGLGGRERSTGAYASLFSAAGFDFIGATPTTSGFAVFQASATGPA